MQFLPIFLCFLLAILRNSEVVQASIELVAGKCYSCTSTAMTSQWQTLGYPAKNIPTFQDNRCLTPSADPPSGYPAIPQVSCSGNCVTLLFQDPDAVKGVAGGSLKDDASSYLVVRGCLETLLGYTPTTLIATDTWKDLGDPTNNVKKIQGRCTGGLGKAFAQDQTAQDVWEFMAVCPTGSSDCHGKAASSMYDSSCTPTAPTTYTCEYCATSDSNCNTASTCNGLYCTKSYKKVAGRRDVSKTCTFINPFMENTCFDFDSSVYVPTSRANIPIKGRQCYCSSSKCNGAGRVFGSIIGMMISALLIKIPISL